MFKVEYLEEIYGRYLYFGYKTFQYKLIKQLSKSIDNDALMGVSFIYEFNNDSSKAGKLQVNKNH